MSTPANRLALLRQGGADAFLAHGLPDRRVEAWKYTSLRGFETGVEGRDTVTPVVDRRYLSADVPVEALMDRLAAGDSDLEELLTALETGSPSRSFSALNNAALDSGLFIRVPAGQDAGRLEWDWRNHATGGWFHSRVCLILEAGSRLELYERFGDGLAASLNVVLQIALGEGARLDHARLQAGIGAAALVTRTEVTLAARAAYAYSGLDLDGRLVRHDLHARLQGSGADCAMRGAYLPRGHSHIDNHLEIEHQAPGCSSRQFFRGVVDGEARAVFNGRVHVHPGADGTEARQSNANLLLSPHAEVNAKPELQIEADEVIASHGATVGQLDEDAVFYLRSRGLDEAAARQLLTAAFCRAVIEQMNGGPVRDRLGEALAGATGESA